MEFLKSLIYPIEIIAFFFSIYYFYSNKNKKALFIVLFLGITILIESIANYTYYIEEVKILNKLIGTGFEKNYWLYNSYLLISYLFYINLFKWELSSIKIVKYFNIASISFFLISIIYFLFFGDFFNSYSFFSIVAGALLVLVSISFFYLDILKGDKVLEIKNSLPFYISIGALIFHLCVTPIMIFSSYFSQSKNPEFVIFYGVILSLSNIILYSSYIVGFLVCAKSNKKEKGLIDY